jgi:hypothetical protein
VFLFPDADAGYMSFGVGGDDQNAAMVGGDVAVAYFNNDQPMVDDYYLQSKALVSTVD